MTVPRESKADESERCVAGYITAVPTAQIVNCQRLNKNQSKIVAPRCKGPLQPFLSGFRKAFLVTGVSSHSTAQMCVPCFCIECRNRVAVPLTGFVELQVTNFCYETDFSDQLNWFCSFSSCNYHMSPKVKPTELSSMSSLTHYPLNIDN